MKYVRPELHKLNHVTVSATCISNGTGATEENLCTHGGGHGNDDCHTGSQATSSHLIGSICHTGIDAAGVIYSCWGNGAGAVGHSDSCKSHGGLAESFGNSACWDGLKR